MKRIGPILLSLGVVLLVASFLGAVKTDIVIDVSFALAPGEKYGPYANGTYHHTKVISISTLMGEVQVEGGTIYFTANGYNTKPLKNVLIDQDYSWVIDHADDLYTFSFENTDVNAQALVTFTLQEKWINILLLIPGFIGLLILTPIGLALSIICLSRKRCSSFNLHPAKRRGVGVEDGQILQVW